MVKWFFCSNPRARFNLIVLLKGTKSDLLLFRSRHPSYSDKNAVNYNSDHHRSSNTSRKHGKRESDRHKRKDPKKEYNQDNYYGNMVFIFV